MAARNAQQLHRIVHSKSPADPVREQGVCFVPVILLLPMVWGMNGILYAQPIADVISVVITVFMALHLHRELSMAEKQVMSNSEM